MDLTSAAQGGRTQTRVPLRFRRWPPASQIQSEKIGRDGRLTRSLAAPETLGEALVWCICIVSRFRCRWRFGCDPALALAVACPGVNGAVGASNPFLEAPPGCGPRGALNAGHTWSHPVADGMDVWCSRREGGQGERGRTREEYFPLRNPRRKQPRGNVHTAPIQYSYQADHARQMNLPAVSWK